LRPSGVVSREFYVGVELKKKKGSEICNLSSRADYRRTES